MWGRGTVTVLHSWPSPGVARALSLSPGSTAGIVSRSVSVFLCFLSDSAPVPHSWELTTLTLTTGSRAGGPLWEWWGGSQKRTALGCRRGYPNIHWWSRGQAPGLRVDESDGTVEPLPVQDDNDFVHILLTGRSRTG